MERFAIAVGILLMMLLAFSTVAPYACAWSGPECKIPADLVRQIDQNQNTIQNLAVALFSFLFGASVGSRLKDTAIADMARSAQNPITPPATGVGVAMQPGDTVSVTAAQPGDPPA